MNSRTHPALPTHDRARSWSETLTATSLYIGVALFLVNQRAGWNDSSGVNLVAVVLRPDIWISIGIVSGMIWLANLHALSPRAAKLYRPLLFYAPATFIGLTLFASMLSAITRGQLFDSFGLADLFKMIQCWVLGVVVFRLCLTREEFAPRILEILKWTPAANIFIGIFAVTTLINNIPGFNDITAEGTLGSGFIGLGGRFQGLGSNPNIAATQSTIGLCLVIAELTQSGRLGVARRILLSCYGIALCMLVIWTGVRAALVVWGIIFFVLLWLRLRANSAGLLRAAALFLNTGLFVALVWFATSAMDLQETLLDRLQEDDGRLFLWDRYLGILMQNPLGLGLSFESITQADSIIEGQRLPPHNTLLQAGMYGGIAAVGVSLFLLYRGFAIIKLVKKAASGAQLTPEFTGACLAWVSAAGSLMFAGLLHADFNFSLVTALLLALATRTAKKLPTKRNTVGNTV